MLRPTKHSHPDRTIINVSLVLLTRLKENRIDSFGDLREYAKKTVPGCDVLFLPALGFLYLLGLINYRSKTDSLEYQGHNETG